MARAKFKDRDRGMKRLNKLFPGMKIKVGFLKEKASEPKKKLDGGVSDATLVEIAVVHEFGATIARGETEVVIPERSYIRSAWDENSKKYFKEARKEMALVASDRRRKPLKGAERVGQEMVDDIKDKIGSSDLAPLAQSTINRKGHSQPLIATFQLFESIDFKVETE